MQEDREVGLQEGRRRREEALVMLEIIRGAWLEEARDIAEEICLEQGWVTADDIRERHPVPIGIHPNVMGAVFHTRRFQKQGWAQTTRPVGHARWFGVWILRDDEEE